MLGSHGIIVIKGHDSAVGIDGHKSDAINIDKNLVGDEKDIEITASYGLVSSREDPLMEKSTMDGHLPSRLKSFFFLKKKHCSGNKTKR
jgi:hypothetical protein